MKALILFVATFFSPAKKKNILISTTQTLSVIVCFNIPWKKEGDTHFMYTHPLSPYVYTVPIHRPRVSHPYSAHFLCDRLGRQAPA